MYTYVKFIVIIRKLLTCNTSEYTYNLFVQRYNVIFNTIHTFVSLILVISIL